MFFSCFIFPVTCPQTICLAKENHLIARPGPCALFIWIMCLVRTPWICLFLCPLHLPLSMRTSYWSCICSLDCIEYFEGIVLSRADRSIFTLLTRHCGFLIYANAGFRMTDLPVGWGGPMTAVVWKMNARSAVQCNGPDRIGMTRSLNMYCRALVEKPARSLWIFRNNCLASYSASD